MLRAFRIADTHKLCVPKEILWHKESIDEIICEHIMDALRGFRKGSRNFDNTSLTLLCDIYLVTSLAYYLEESPIIPDSVYDALCRHLYGRHTDIMDTYPNKELIDKSNLSAGTGYTLKFKDLSTSLRLAYNEATI